MNLYLTYELRTTKFEIQMLKKKLSVLVLVPALRRICSIHVVVLQRTATQILCTSVQSLYCSLDLLFSDVAVVVTLRFSQTPHQPLYSERMWVIMIYEKCPCYHTRRTIYVEFTSSTKIVHSFSSEVTGTSSRKLTQKWILNN